MAELFTKIVQDASRKGKKLGDTQTRDWFRDRAMSVSKINPSRLMLQGNRVNKIEPGKMYMFFYDPKWKETLPYYDTFPVLFPFSVLPQHFIGMNLHYLPPLLRARLMDALYDLTESKITEDSRLRLSYNILKGASGMSMFKPTVHMYRYDHLRSNFLEIPATEWDVAAFIPTHRFKKASARTVWNESRDKI